jgi:hypothetical protein
MKRDATDAIVSDLIREASDWICERCGLGFPDRKSRAFHASHYFSRAYNATRWFPDNLSGLCGKCHDEVGKDPGAHHYFMLMKLGDVRMSELRIRKNTFIARYKAADKKAMREHYREELERIRALRMEGRRGVVEVVAYD